ncbi:DinB family protein [Streptomyces sp. UH6]|uniref:DinB family protein n=1 Tax=Streptomyces sp. UH6 TaxID=2748379 RepID=UPI0035BC1342
MTTIAWRLGHMVVGVLGMRSPRTSGGPAADHTTFSWAGTADEALAQLDAAYAAWTAGVRGLGGEGLARRCGPAEHAFAEYPMASLVLHVNREMIHHGAEVALLRDLHRAGGAAGPVGRLRGGRRDGS